MDVGPHEFEKPLSVISYAWLESHASATTARLMPSIPIPTASEHLGGMDCLQGPDEHACAFACSAESPPDGCYVDLAERDEPNLLPPACIRFDWTGRIHVNRLEYPGVWHNFIHQRRRHGPGPALYRVPVELP